MVEYRGITYSILEGSSQKYTRLLVSSLGYSYGVKMLQMKATTNATRTLIGYLRRQWMDNPVFPAEDWSVYRQKV